MKDPELNLAIAACRATFGDGSVTAAMPAIGGVDWERYLKVVARHRVQALCWHGLEPASDLVPDAITDELRQQAGSIVESNLRIAAESARILNLFQSANVRLLFLKGLALGALAYRMPFLKMGWDIDILISRDQLADAARLLRSAGYIPLLPRDGDDLEAWHRSRKESVWHLPGGGFHLDLHTRLADNPALLPEVGINSASQLVPVAKGVELPTLGTDELFAYLAVHGASSAWFRLKWITDFAALLHGRRGDEIERLYDRAQRLKAGRAAAQALLLAERIYATDIGNSLRDRLEADPMNRRLARLAEKQIAVIGEPTKRFMGTAAIHLSQPFLLPGWRFKVSEAARQLRDVIGAARR